MKPYLVIFFIFLLVLPFTYATRVNLDEGQSYVKDGRNITLLALDNARNKALFCVNNEKAIVNEDGQKTVNEVSLALKSISDGNVRVDINVYCKDCECDENCLNLNCYNPKKTTAEQIQEEIILEENKELVSLQTENVEIVENPGLSTGGISLALAIIVLFIIFLYYLTRK